MSKPSPAATKDAAPHALLEKGSSRQRLIRGFAATALGPFTGTLVQLFSVPIFLRGWGAATYGEWLVIIAIPTYLLLSDMGFGSVAGNAMTLNVAGNDRARALAIFQSSRLLVIVVSLMVAMIASIALPLAPIATWMNITHIQPQEVRLIVGLLIAQVLLHVHNNTIVLAFRCEGMYAFGTCCLNLATLAETATATGIVLAGGRPLHAAAAFCATKCASAVVLAVVLRRRIKWIRLGFSKARVGLIRELTVPACAYMAFPLGNAISMQGMVLVIGSMSNPVNVVIFSTLRTLSRFGTQLIGLISNSIWPELSIAFGYRQIARARQLHRRACQLTVWLALVTVVGLAIVGPMVYPIWVTDQIPMDYTVFHILLLAVVANSFWNASSIASIARNSHQRIATIYIVGTLLSIAVTMLSMPLLGVKAPPLCLLALDIMMVGFTVRSSTHLLGDIPSDLLRSTLSAPPLAPMARSLIRELRLLWS